ncbi:MAG: trypsin-like serine protease, partial [Bdellovibrionaceae bacterium]|nr:trypsin-like serine protease [Pseudobdellovibrionaceae bacterium]
IATAYHMVKGMEKFYFNDHINRKIIYLKFLADYKKYDLALLQVESRYFDREYKELDINNYDLSERIKKEESVTIIGFPNGSFTKIQGTLISQEDFLRTSFVEKRTLRTFIFHLIVDKEFLLIKTDSKKDLRGLSGSPVISKEEEFLGILVGGSQVIPVIAYTPVERLRNLVIKTLEHFSN